MDRLINAANFKTVCEVLEASGAHELLRDLLSDCPRLLSGLSWTEEDLLNEVRQEMSGGTYKSEYLPFADALQEAQAKSVTEQVLADCEWGDDDDLNWTIRGSLRDAAKEVLRVSVLSVHKTQSA